VRANLERLYGLDEPLPAQYLKYLGALARGDFGVSLRERDFTVTELIARIAGQRHARPQRPALALLSGIPAGIAAALWRRRRADHGVAALSALALALPSFVVGPLLALIFGLYLHWLPVAGWQWGSIRYLVVPATTLALPVAAALARLMRASLLETLRAGFVRSARARGLGAARVLWRHALPPALRRW
jgi:oligopeptide transport system permease protein